MREPDLRVDRSSEEAAALESGAEDDCGGVEGGVSSPSELEETVEATLDERDSVTRSLKSAGN